MSSTPRYPLWLLSLTLAAFAVQTDDFIIIGVLPSIAESVHSTETTVGQLVTVYSLTYAIAAPIWALSLPRASRHRALCTALAVFTVANLAVLPVSSLPVLMGLRVVAALAAAVVLPCALAAAATYAPPRRQGGYLATVMTGLTGAVLVGVPAGTWIGASLGWRTTFVFAGLIGLAALLLIRTSPPPPPPPPPTEQPTPTEEHPRVAELLRPLLTPVVAVVLVVTALAVAGNLAFQTYLAPFLAGLAGATPATLAALLVCSGVGGVLGTQLAGRLVDRHGPLRTFALACAVFCGSMLALGALWVVRPVSVVAVAALLSCWSAAAWAIPPSLQSLLLARAGADTAAQSMAVQSSTVYVGAALGATLGGLALAHSPALLPLTAVATTALALGLAVAFARTLPGADAPQRPAGQRPEPAGESATSGES